MRYWSANMFQTDLDQSGRWLSIHYSGHVDAAQVDACLERVRQLLDGVQPGLRVLTDLTGLELMDASCAAGVGMIMDLLVEKQVASVFRVIPHPQKDIGLSLMSHFHYGREVRIVTYENLAEALQNLTT